MYPSHPGGTFDFNYYRDTHMGLMRQHPEPHGLKNTNIRRGAAEGVGGGADGISSFICIGSRCFDSARQYIRAMAPVGKAASDDRPNFTNITPTRHICEMVEQERI